MRSRAASSAAAGVIQIFNQSPRQWKPTVYDDEKVAAYKEAMAESDVEALLIDAVYLVNCASEDAELREKSLASLDRLAARRGGARRRVGRRASGARR